MLVFLFLFVQVVILFHFLTFPLQFTSISLRIHSEGGFVQDITALIHGLLFRCFPICTEDTNLPLQ